MLTLRQFLALVENTTAAKRNQPDFPPTILLRRIAIRQYPDHRQLAIYRDQATGTDYAIPPMLT